MPTRENEHIPHIFFWPFGLKNLLKLFKRLLKIEFVTFCRSNIKYEI